MWIHDLRQAFRGLRKAPAFTAVAVLTLALGIGATTALFSFLSGLLLDPFPFPDSRTLVLVDKDNPRFDFEGMWPNAAEWETWRATPYTESFSGFRVPGKNLVDGDAVKRVATAEVRPGYFEVVGRRVVQGRGFAEGEFEPGGGEIPVLLAHDFFESFYDGDPSVIGRRVRLDDDLAIVVGILDPGPTTPLQGASLVTPLVLDEAALSERSAPEYLIGVARVEDAAALAAFEADLATRQLQMEEAQPTGMDGWVPRAKTLSARVVGDTRQTLLVLFGAVLVVLLIACANITSLLLARAHRRRGEIAVRAALGASRARLMRQLLLESLALATLGGLFGVGLAYGLVRLMVQLAPGSLPRLETVTVDGSVLLFSMGLIVVTSVLFGLLPALGASRTGVRSNRGNTDSQTGTRLREALVVGQVALAVILLVGAGLLMQSLVGLLRVEPGFATERVNWATIYLPQYRLPDAVRQNEVVSELVEAVETLPGVERAAASNWVPLSGGWARSQFEIEGQDAPVDEDKFAFVRMVTPGYFDTMGVALLEGRDFGPQDRRPEPAVRDESLPPLTSDELPERAVLINRRMAERFWPAGDAMGGRFRNGGETSPWMRVVGIVGNERQLDLKAAPGIGYYLPYTTNEQPVAGFELMMRSTGGVLRADDLRAVTTRVDPEIAVVDLRELAGVVDRQLARPRFQLSVLGALALLALVLSAIGLYGVVTYSVGQRTREIGVRVAVGADASRIFRLVSGRGALMVGIGLGMGTASAFVLSRVLDSMLHEVSSRDPGTFAAVAILMAVVALVAVIQPALRATRIDPIEALRPE